MKFLPRRLANKFVASDSCTVWEYALDSDKLSGAVAEITGRHPDHGFMLNEVSDEFVYVISGSGKLLTPANETDLAQGDTALIEAGDKFAWEGEKLVVCIPCVPAWNPAQHKLVD